MIISINNDMCCSGGVVKRTLQAPEIFNKEESGAEGTNTRGNSDGITVYPDCIVVEGVEIFRAYTTG